MTTVVIRLVPKYNLNQKEADKNIKIKKCVKIQEQFHAQLSSEEVLELTDIDTSISWWNNVTLREKIMDFRKKNAEEQKLFVAVEKRLIGQGYDIYYPKNHKDEALEYIKHLQLYLTKTYGLNMRRDFSSRVQDIIDTIV